MRFDKITMNDFLNSVDRIWTLFLDRDGVINKRPVGDYVKSPEGFDFLPGVLDALRTLSEKFGRIVIVTNQQGIGKNLMTEGDLEAVHQKMMAEIDKTGGRIDKIYYCPDLAKSPENCRKPGLTMANRAKADFPEIDFRKSVMAGDTKSDLEFGRNAGMIPVLINTNRSKLDSALFDAEFQSLISFAQSLVAND